MGQYCGAIEGITDRRPNQVLLRASRRGVQWEALCDYRVLIRREGPSLSIGLHRGAALLWLCREWQRLYTSCVGIG